MQNQRGCGGQDCWPTAFVLSFLGSPVWQALTNEAISCRIGFFYDIRRSSDLEGFSFALNDTLGNVVESVNYYANMTDPCAKVLQAALEADLSVGVKESPAFATAGRSVTYQFAVTNQGPGAAYGVFFSLPLAGGVDFVAVNGSQGQGYLTNGSVMFEVGPLASGAVATIEVRVVPLTSGQVKVADQAAVVVGDRLTDVNSGNNVVSFGPVAVAQPKLAAILKPGGQVEVSWTSESDRIGLQSASGVGEGAVWTSAPEPLQTSGNQRRAQVNSATERRFFRLRGL